MIGLYQTDVIRRRSPWRGFEDVEYATLERVSWANTQRVLAPLGYLASAEVEERFVRDQAAQAEPLAVNEPSPLKTRGG